jgi:hypothetical protein
MKCQKCESERLCYICSKSSDLNNGVVVGTEFDGYVPDDIGIGGGDYVDFTWCLECGQIQGQFPLETPEKYIVEPEELV